MTKEILGKDGKTKFIEVTAQTKIPQLKNNNLDAVLATMTITDERKKSVDFSTPYFKAGTSLMTKTSSLIKSIKDLNHKGRVAIVVKGTTAADDIARLAPKAKIRQYNDYGACTNALLAGQGTRSPLTTGFWPGLPISTRACTWLAAQLPLNLTGLPLKRGRPRCWKLSTRL